jgi:hypothetical protein
MKLFMASISCFFISFLIFFSTSGIYGQNELGLTYHVEQPGLEEAVHDFRMSVENEINKLNNGDYGYSKEENTVRIDLLQLAVKEAANGYRAQAALRRSALKIKNKFNQNSRFQNVDLKQILQEYTNQFS